MARPEERSGELAGLTGADPRQSEELFQSLYADLRRIAAAAGGKHGAPQRYDPTSLIHEAYVRFQGSGVRDRFEREHFLAVATKAMRSILVDRARRGTRARHGGDEHRITLELLIDGDTRQAVDLVDIDDALTKLGELDEKQARVMELRLFAGLPDAEIAGLLDVTDRTVRNYRRGAVAWLRKEIEGAREPPPSDG